MLRYDGKGQDNYIPTNCKDLLRKFPLPCFQVVHKFCPQGHIYLYSLHKRCFCLFLLFFIYLYQNCLDAEKAEHEKEIEKLQNEIDELNEREDTAEETGKLKADYEKKIKKLKEQAMQAATASDEKIKALEEKIKNAGKADEKLVEFKFYFNETQEALKKFSAVLDDIDDEEKKEKFRSAAVRFIEAVLDELGGGAE